MLFSNIFRLLFGFFALATLSTAWPWPPYSGKDMYDRFIGKRHSSSSNSSPTVNAHTDSTTSQTKSSTPTVTPPTSATNSASNTGKDTDKATTGTNATQTSPGSATSTYIDPRLPPGGISMITPAVEAPVTYYKIGNHVTFAWNYTSLSVTPSAVDVLATCTLNSATYTISSNMSVKETGAVTWDTHGYQATATIPLLTASYTLIVVPAGQAITAIPSAGHLAVGQYPFIMYLPQAYTPLNDGFVCATCNAAMSDMERQALGFIFMMATITVLSFTWFASGSGVFG